MADERRAQHAAAVEQPADAKPCAHSEDHQQPGKQGEKGDGEHPKRDREKDSVDGKHAPPPTHKSDAYYERS